MPDEEPAEENPYVLAANGKTPMPEGGPRGVGTDSGGEVTIHGFGRASDG